MATLLLELFSEEIPSRMQRGAAEQLQRLMLAGFEKQLLKPTDVKTFVSPRHLAIQLFGMPTTQPDMREERRGPKIGAPEQALKGFLQSTGLTLDQCEQRDGYYYATIERKGQAVAAVAKKIIEETLAAFSWPKSMRWGSGNVAWVRPLHRIVALLDSTIVPSTFAHLTASNITEGHRFLSTGTITIQSADSYEAQLNAAHVVVDFAARRAQIATEIAELAATAKLAVRADDALLDEVTGLVEWPVPILCNFDAAFLTLPPEVLVSEMKNHQRYFALQNVDGALSNQFITVANMVTTDGGAKVRAGNGRVVRARLSDGEFYWEQDKKTSLEQWGIKLSDVVFHAKVGMMDAKVARIETLALAIADAVQFTDKKAVSRAAQLAKADLTSGMVGEFPELQGIMGRYYALAQRESPEVADAIRGHYKPLGAGDSLPEAPLAAIIAVADKLDSITSLFAAGEKPTGSKDPLALRRAALGILRIVLNQGWNIDLAQLGVKGEAEEFFRDRLKNLLRDAGVRHDVIEASLVHATGCNILRMHDAAWALHNLTTTSAGANTITAIKRAQNILAAEEKKSKQTFSYAADRCTALTEPSENKLQQLVASFKGTTPESLNALTDPINAFFADVMVNADDPKLRDARLALLAGVRDCASTIADFSKIEG